MNRYVILTLAALSVSMVGCNQSSHPDGKEAMASAQDPSAMDLHNTVCPVSGDAVGDSTLTEVYDGKVYHFCCADCPAQFKAKPAMYAGVVAANPAKYGVK